MHFGNKNCDLESNICSPEYFLFLMKFNKLIFTSTQDNHNTAALMLSNKGRSSLKTQLTTDPSANKISVTPQVPGGYPVSC